MRSSRLFQTDCLSGAEEPCKILRLGVEAAELVGILVGSSCHAAKFGYAYTVTLVKEDGSIRLLLQYYVAAPTVFLDHSSLKSAASRLGLRPKTTSLLQRRTLESGHLGATSGSLPHTLAWYEPAAQERLESQSIPCMGPTEWSTYD